MENDLLTMLERLEELIDDAATVPFTKKVILNNEEIYRLIDELRKAIPDGMQQAHRVVRERDRILSQAREEAEAMVKETQSYAEKLTKESVIAQKAQAEAAAIIDEARRESREVRVAARNYAAELLQRVEGSLQKCMGIVRQGLEELEPVKAMAEGAETNGKSQKSPQQAASGK